MSSISGPTTRGDGPRTFEHLPGRSVDEPLTWLLQAKEHTLLQVHCRSAWGGVVDLEVRL